MVFIIDHIYHLINEFKMLIFAYNNDPILQLCVTERFWTSFFVDTKVKLLLLSINLTSDRQLRLYLIKKL